MQFGSNWKKTLRATNHAKKKMDVAISTGMKGKAKYHSVKVFMLLFFCILTRNINSLKTNIYPS